MLLIFSFYIIFTFYIMHIVFIVFMFHKHFKYILNNNNRNTVNNFQTCGERGKWNEKNTQKHLSVKEGTAREKHMEKEAGQVKSPC